jgi:hypothetical protein
MRLHAGYATNSWQILLVPQVALFADSYIFRMALYGDTRRIDFLSVGFPMLINF